MQSGAACWGNPAGGDQPVVYNDFTTWWVGIDGTPQAAKVLNTRADTVYLQVADLTLVVNGTYEVAWIAPSDVHAAHVPLTWGCGA
jgi:phosphatidylserine decarboxylase